MIGRFLKIIISIYFYDHFGPGCHDQMVAVQNYRKYQKIQGASKRIVTLEFYNNQADFTIFATHPPPNRLPPIPLLMYQYLKYSTCELSKTSVWPSAPAYRALQ